MSEGEVAGGAVSGGGGEVVLSGDGGRLDDDRASDVALGDEDFLGAADEFAVDDVVADVHADRLEAGGVGVELEGGRVALFEDEWGGLVGVGGVGGGGIGWGVVDASHGELEGRDGADFAVEDDRSTGAGDLVQQTVYVVVDGDAGEAGADGCVGDVGADAVAAGGAGHEGGADGANGGNLGGAHVVGDHADVTVAGAAGDRDDLADVSVVGGAGACGEGDGVGRTSLSAAGDGASHLGPVHAASLKGGSEAGGRSSGAGTGEFDGELALDAAVGQQLLGGAEVRANEVAAYDVTLDGRDGEVTDQDGISSGGGNVGAVGGLSLDEDETFAEQEGHEDYLSGGVGGSVRRTNVRTPVSGSRRYKPPCPWNSSTRIEDAGSVVSSTLSEANSSAVMNSSLRRASPALMSSSGAGTEVVVRAIGLGEGGDGSAVADIELTGEDACGCVSLYKVKFYFGWLDVNGEAAKRQVSHEFGVK